MSALPLQFTTKAEAVYAELRARIVGGTLAPGTPMNQDALALDLGVSVTPVREAMRRLEADGLVQFEAHKTGIVTPLSRAELAEVYDIREQLDPHASAAATLRVDGSDLDELYRLARIEPRSDPVEQVAINREFHRAIYVRAGNAMLTEILDRLWQRTDRYRVFLVTREVDVALVTSQHLEIVDAMLAREPRRVAKLVRAHVAAARLQIEDALG
jgi:DNA-binding GntR family transcriptional regulator